MGKGNRAARKQEKLADQIATTAIKARASMATGAPDWVREIQDNQARWKN